jgi:hypothetical protein
MKFPQWSLFLFPIPAIVVTTMFPILVIVVAVAVAIWAVIARQKAAATKTQDKPAVGENDVQAIAAPDGYRRQDPRTRVHDDDAA